MNQTNESKFYKLKTELIANSKTLITLLNNFEEDDITNHKAFQNIRHARKSCSDSYLRFSQYIIETASNPD